MRKSIALIMAGLCIAGASTLSAQTSPPEQLNQTDPSEQRPNRPRGSDQNPVGSNVGAEFSVLDQNNDGFITRDELNRDSLRARQFASLDRDRNGKITRDEFPKAPIEQRHDEDRAKDF
ncbi:EF-hand domain-containing protein [Tahibacter amnicola]|uniref:EF-hand domain-containing protein n=1 Tax=Tahibacter amnicola TaxID=2976241 RepID=A0ABY6BG51_9GAMM|nr:EF-hand domain-containing protein [Tahibacter amnicola]UXI67586.1 EF-hand domain-containing protein [Tahibacter amnicola]